MVSHIYEAIGNLFGEEKPPEELGDPIDFMPGVLVDSGISWVYLFRKMLIPLQWRVSAGICPPRCESKRHKCCKT